MGKHSGYFVWENLEGRKAFKQETGLNFNRKSNEHIKMITTLYKSVPPHVMQVYQKEAERQTKLRRAVIDWKEAEAFVRVGLQRRAEEQGQQEANADQPNTADRGQMMMNMEGQRQTVAESLFELCAAEEENHERNCRMAEQRRQNLPLMTLDLAAATSSSHSYNEFAEDMDEFAEPAPRQLQRDKVENDAFCAMIRNQMQLNKWSRASIAEAEVEEARRMEQTPRLGPQRQFY